MLAVLTACIGVTSVCLSQCWVKVIPWLHWAFRFCFVIKTESQRLKKTAAVPWKPSLCHTVMVDPWGPPLRAGQMPSVSWQQAWQSTGMHPKNMGQQWVYEMALSCHVHHQLVVLLQLTSCLLCTATVLPGTESLTVLLLEGKRDFFSKRFAFIGAPVWLVVEYVTVFMEILTAPLDFCCTEDFNWDVW